MSGSLSVTAPGFVARRRHRRAQAERQARPRAGRQHRPRPRRGRASSRPTGSRPRRCCGPSRWSPTAGCRPSSSTPAGPTPAPGRTGFADTHRTAEHVAEALSARGDGGRGRRRRGLLHRADRGPAADGQDRRPGSPRSPPLLDDDGGADAARAIMTTDTVAKRRATPTRAGRSAAWPRAPACSLPAWPPCSS